MSNKGHLFIEGGVGGGGRAFVSNLYMCVSLERTKLSQITKFLKNLQI